MKLINFPVAISATQSMNSELVFDGSGVFYSYKEGVLITEIYLDDPDCWLSSINLNGESLIQASPYKKPEFILGENGHRLDKFTSVDQVFLNEKFSGESAYVQHVIDEMANSSLHVYNLQSKTKFEKEISVVNSVVIDSNIYGTLVGSGRGNNNLMKYDLDLNECWRVKETKVESRYFDSKFINDFNDSIIYCAGSDITVSVGEIGSFTIDSRYKETGDMKWQAGFASYIHSLSLAGNRVYLAHETEMVVLDAHTGEILMRKQSGFKNEGYNKIRCIDDKVFFQNTLCNKFKIFNKYDLGHITNIDIPLPYAPSPNHGPEKIGKKIYWYMRSNEPAAFDVHHGYLIISPEELEQPEPRIMEFEKKPDIQTQCLQDEEGVDYYQITVTGENLDDVLRFSEVEVKYVAAMYGTQFYTSDKVNKNFGGKIILNITKEILNNPDDEKLKILDKRLDSQLDEFYSAGNKQDRCRCQCEWV